MQDWLRLENGMTLNREALPPERTEQERCDRCRTVQEDVRFFRNGDCICGDCLSAYLEERADELAEGFIRRQERDFYISWWFDGMEPAEKLALLKTAYWRQADMEAWLRLAPTMAADRVEFCRLHPYYPEFALEQLS